MKHYGDITKLSGHDLPVVDCITGGSPCQDLSVAGKRAGLGGERSGLFMEQIRIVKEMREHDKDSKRSAEFIRPRFMVWENVPGAFSSNKGEDFQAVLTEIVRIAEPETPDVPMPDKGKWPKAGCIYDELGRWSVAWRVHDAQFWGVPQRRKRIALVADFGGLSAPEVLFERKGLSGDFTESREEGERPSGKTEERTDTPITHSVDNSTTEPVLLESNQKHATIQTNGVSTALPASMGMGGGYTPMIVEDQDKCLNSWDVQSKHVQPENGIAEALYSGECRGGGGESYVMQSAEGVVTKGNGDAFLTDETHTSLSTGGGQAGQGYPCVMQTYRKASHPRTADESQNWEETSTNDTLNAFDNSENRTPTLIVLEGNGQRDSHKGDGYKESETMYTLNTVEQHAVCTEDKPTAYGISSFDSNAMKSPNPNSGIYEADTSRTLDMNGGNPSCNQGGIAIVDTKQPEALSFQERAGKPGGGKGILIQYDKIGTMNTSNNQIVLSMTDDKEVVGVDTYNLQTTGDIGRTLTTPGGGLNEHMPVIMEAAGFDGNKGDKSDIAYHEETSPSLIAVRGMHVLQTNWDGSQVSPTLTANNADGRQRMPDKDNFNAVITYGVDSYNQSALEEKSETLRTNGGGDNSPKVFTSAAGFDGSMGAKAGNIGYQEDASPTLNAGKEMHVATYMDVGWLQATEEKATSLLARQYKDPPITNTVGALCNTDYKGIRNQNVDQAIVQNTVRRLTPLECERLQGFPDGWTDIGDWIDSKGKLHKQSDSPRYKALGNSIALPFWFYLLRRISAQYERPATLGSLFDGIGGFPLCWERCNGKGTAIWASEIEEFPIAVTKIRFPENESEGN